MENNIDDIFNKAIEPLHTEPSDDFWRKAAENIIVRGSEATEQKVARWRAIAVILGAGLLILGYFTYRMESGLENMDKQIKAVKNVQDQNIAKWNKTNTITKNTNTIVSTVSNNPATDKKSQDKVGKPANISLYSPVSRTYKVTATGTTTSYKKQNAQLTVPSIAFNQPQKNAVEHKKVTNSLVEQNTDSKTLSNTQQPENSPSKEITASNSSLQKATDVSVATSLSKDSDNSEDIASDTTIETSNQTAVASSFDPKVVQQAKQLTNDTISRLNVTAYFSPDFLMGYGFKATNATAGQSENSIKNGEKPNFSYTTGASAEYAVSPNFSISAGLAYQVFSFDVKPTTIYNEKQTDGDAGYYVTTSSGILNCPYNGYSKLGDSLSINATSSRRYLEIPLEAKYFFVNTKNFRAYATAGLEVNFSIGENTVMNWQTTWNESGTDNITNTEGSRNMYFSYYVGMGASYKAGRNWAVYIEPGLHNAITPIDDNIALITYPKLFSVSVGVVYTVR